MGPNAPPLESVPLPPMLVVVGEKDLIHDTNLEYCDALRAAGKDVEVLINRSMTHSFYLNKFAVEWTPPPGSEPKSHALGIVRFVYVGPRKDRVGLTQEPTHQAGS
ncbi:putative carboxylesterase 15 [Hordeum vulgare]|nr:putative carboxylesterase 15 [Hordeum vulgare]